MVAADHSWFHSLLKTSPKNDKFSKNEAKIGILSFEVAGLMSKVIELWKFLNDNDNYQVFFNTIGVRKLVSYDDNYMLGLIYDEMISNFCDIARTVARLAKKCSDSHLKSLEHDFDDHLLTKNDGKFSYKKMDKKIKQMEDLVLTNQCLYEEMQALLKLEETLGDKGSFASLIEFERKVVMKEQKVQQLKNIAIWNCTYDDIVGVLVRALFTIFDKIELVFGVVHVGDIGSIKHSSVHSSSGSVSRQSWALIHPFENNDPGRRNGGMDQNQLGHFVEKLGVNKTGWWPISKANGKTPLEPFMRCIGDYSRGNVLQNKNISVFSSRNRMKNAPPGTLGEAALAQLYAKVIVEIEKLMVSPLLIRNDPVSILEKRLPQSVSFAVRKRMRFPPDSLVSVEHWIGKLSQILDWLAPLAHYTKRKWESEQSYAHQNIVFDSEKVLLVQTLHYANQEKTDAAVSELFVGLKYICRIQVELGANSSDESAYGGSSDQEFET